MRSARPIPFLLPWLLAAASSAVALSAQSPAPAPAAPAAPREIVLQNLAPFPRREVASVVVPFAQGVAREAPQLSIADRPTVWEPFGARWPDGSWRQALCLFEARVDKLSEVRLPLLAGGGGVSDAEIAMPAHQLVVELRQGERVVREAPVRVRDLEKNPLRRVELRRARLADTGLVAELILTVGRDQRHIDVALTVFCSDPTIAAMQCPVDELAVRVKGMALVLRHPGYLGVHDTLLPDGSRAVLLRKSVIGDGQGLRRVGVLVPPLAGADALADDTLRAAAVVPLLAATSWRETSAFGPFGLVPPPPPWLAGNALRGYFARRHRLFVQRERPGGDPFGVFPHGLQRMAGQTGDQADFGTEKLGEVAWSGVPSMLLEVELSVLQEACRPVHFFELDGEPVDPAQHPDWVVWSGRTHWHPEVSKDRLGKPVPEPPFEAHGWTGKDRQHWSNNYLAAYALLTGAHWARRELENEARLYLAGQTIDPEFTTSHSGAPRGAGRTELSASWNLCVTGDERLRERMLQRLEQVYFPEWAGRTLADDRVRPMAVNDPDERQLHGKFAYWNPWQDALAAVGYAAVHRLTGDDKARTLAEALACNVVRHGWRLDEQVDEVAMAMRWLDGAPFTAEQWRSRDETLVQWGFQTAFSEWSMGAVEIARVVAERDGDAALLQKAKTIQAHRREHRVRPPDEYPTYGGVDRLTEWDAVRWDAK
ncbi:MAG: hypothetical protein H6835_11510 [Planctomycetes bacterium]|nr:hypothetical protein [Planctomycetota bacterium]